MRRMQVVLAGLLFTSAVFAQAPKESAPQSQGEATPFDFRGVRLGITVSEFKALPILDRDWDDRRAPKFVRCGPDDNRERAQLGVVSCEWRTADSQGRFETSAALQTGGTYVLMTHLLHFIAKPGDPEPRLFRMLFNSNAHAYGEIVDSLTTKFGKPKVADPALVQNQMGATFNSDTRMWDNGVSTVIAIERSGRIDRMALMYGLTSYEAFFEERKKAERGKAPSKL